MVHARLKLNGTYRDCLFGSMPSKTNAYHRTTTTVHVLRLVQSANIAITCTIIRDWICKNQPPCTRYRNRDSTMNDVIEVWSRSGKNLKAIACIVFEIQFLEARRVG